MTVNDTYLELHFFQFTLGPVLACSVTGFWVQEGIRVTRLQENVGTQHVPEASGVVLQSSLVHEFSTGAVRACRPQPVGVGKRLAVALAQPRLSADPVVGPEVPGGGLGSWSVPTVTLPMVLEPGWHGRQGSGSATLPRLGVLVLCLCHSNAADPGLDARGRQGFRRHVQTG